MAKELHEQILDFLKTKSNDPNVLCTATARALLILMVASIEMYGSEPKNVKVALDVLDQMKQQIIEDFGDGSEG